MFDTSLIANRGEIARCLLAWGLSAARMRLQGYP